ncbi:MAG: selenocysteine-specific translation elongation factor [Vicinamibacterales bacterium]
MPRTVVVGTAGHIDHGKSSLVRALTGTDPDRLKEEKARGITIELGFAHADVAPGVTISFVDVPGHERFVRTMLAGAGGVDAVVLVVAADEGVMPQTREHFDICRLLQVRRGVVALTKADAVDDETLALATLDVRDLVAGSFLDGAPIVPVSAVSGAGLEALRQALAALGDTVERRDALGSTRLPVDRVFTMRGFGTVVTGTLVGGTLRVEDVVAVMPGPGTATVRGLHVHGRPRRDAVAGERVAVNLAGVEVDDVPRGAVLATPRSLAPTRRVDARVSLLAAAAPLAHGARVRLHHGTAEVLARVSIAGSAAAIPSGASADVRLRLERPAVVTRRDRFILRSYSPAVTIGGGVVLDPDPPRLGLRAARALTRLEALHLGDDVPADLRAAAARMLEDAGLAGGSVGSLVPRLGAPAAAVRSALAALADAGRLVVADDWAASRAALDAAGTAMLAAVAAFHRAQPLAAGVPREEARARWFATAAPALVERVFTELAAGGRIVVRDVIALAGHRLELSREEHEVLALLEDRFRAAGLTPPDAAPAALGVALGRPAAVVDRMLQLAFKQRRLVRLDTLVFHPEALAGLKSDLAARRGAAAGATVTVDVKTFKETYGISRKFAIPLLEYLDRERVTRRAGDVRIVL